MTLRFFANLTIPKLGLLNTIEKISGDCALSIDKSKRKEWREKATTAASLSHL